MERDRQNAGSLISAEARNVNRKGMMKELRPVEERWKEEKREESMKKKKKKKVSYAIQKTNEMKAQRAVLKRNVKKKRKEKINWKKETTKETVDHLSSLLLLTLAFLWFSPSLAIQPSSS